MNTNKCFSIYSLPKAKELLDAGFKLDHVALNKKEQYKDSVVFYFIDDGNIKNFLMKGN